MAAPSSSSCFLVTFSPPKTILDTSFTNHLNSSVSVEETVHVYSGCKHDLVALFGGSGAGMVEKVNSLRTRLLKNEKLINTTLLWLNESSLHFSKLHSKRQECDQQVETRKMDQLSLWDNSLHEL